MAQAKYSNDQLPKPGEICAIAQMNEHKRAALLFDRIWVQRSKLNDHAVDIPPGISFGISAIDNTIPEKVASECLKKTNSTIEALGSAILQLPKTIAEEYSRKGIIVTPVYSTEEAFIADIGAGKTRNFQAALSHIPVIEEEKVEWRQILDFRKDKDSVRKYRKLRMWLRDTMEATTLDEAADIIGLKLDDYEFVLKKHGFSTVLGGLSQIIDWAENNKSTSAAVLAAWLSGPIFGGIASAGLAVGAVIWVGERMLERNEIARGEGEEIAVLLDIKKEFGGK